MARHETVEAVTHTHTHFMFTELVDSLERESQFSEKIKGENTFINHIKNKEAHKYLN